jgi:membrane protein implicated in regulation of membrane protease activity
MSGVWIWWTIAAVLLALELLAPGVAFIWLGLAAAAMGFLAFLLPGVPWQAEVAMFAALAAGAVYFVRPWAREETVEDDAALHLNRRMDGYIGRTFELPAAIENGDGHLIIDDTRWRVRGPDLKRGQPVRVTGVDGLTLIVEKAG